jgi:hypothetical protein
MDAEQVTGVVRNRAQDACKMVNGWDDKATGFWMDSVRAGRISVAFWSRHLALDFCLRGQACSAQKQRKSRCNSGRKCGRCELGCPHSPGWIRCRPSCGASGRVVVGTVAAWLGAKVVSVVADAVRKILNPV